MPAFAAGQQASGNEPIEITDPLPYAQSPFDYHGRQTDDAAARLSRRLATGESTLAHDARWGYLLAVLHELDVPVESQVLVFSKTALHPQLVGPRNPRAIYFNDEVYVAWVPGAPAIEIAAVDPHKGAIFYSLPQKSDSPPRISRQSNCLACHVTKSTLGVPGLTVRSVITDDAGKPLFAFPAVNHATAFAKRWGGWFVTGGSAPREHLGNRVGRAAHREPFVDNLDHVEPPLDALRYPSPHSDIVAHLVLIHQVHGQNLLCRMSYEVRLGRRSDAEDRLVRYLLFADERPLTAPVKAANGFAQRFASRGPADSRGRSLRQLNLETRLFEHRLSYLIYSRAFKALPRVVKRRLYTQLGKALSGDAKRADAAMIPQRERQEIVTILRETVPDF